MNQIYKFVLSLICSSVLLSCSQSPNTKNSIDLSKMNTTPSGYHYTKHTQNKGSNPKAGEMVDFHIIQRYDDSITYSSYHNQKPDQILMPPSNQPSSSAVLEVLKVMTTGDSASIYIEVDSFGATALEWQKKYSYLIFDVKLESISNPQVKLDFIRSLVHKKRLDYIQNKSPSIITQQEGLEYEVLQMGNGPKITRGNQISVHYYGALLQGGKKIDDSFSKGKPLNFILGANQVIKGWELALEGLNRQSTLITYIKPSFAYGKTGYPPNIPPDAALIFYIEIL